MRRTAEDFCRRMPQKGDGGGEQQRIFAEGCRRDDGGGGEQQRIFAEGCCRKVTEEEKQRVAVCIVP